MSTVRRLCEQGHDATHLRKQGQERLSDSAILDKARDEGRVVLTFDLDFGDLMATGCHSFPSVVIFRIHDETPASVTPRLLEVIALRRKALEDGAIVIVEEARHRMRRLPLREGDER